MDTKEWAKLQESLLKSQLKVIREFLRKGEEPKFKTRKRRKSQMNVIYDILLISKKTSPCYRHHPTGKTGLQCKS